MKGTRTVLRREGGSNPSDLADSWKVGSNDMTFCHENRSKSKDFAVLKEKMDVCFCFRRMVIGELIYQRG